MALLGARLARLARQPAVVGEMIAVIALGPSLLGWLSPPAESFLFGSASRPVFAALAQLGVAVFILIVGLELRIQLGSSRTVVGVTLGSLFVPLILGALAALTFLNDQPQTPPWAFVLFIGAALSVTAVPVLALILQDRGLSHTPEASTALSAAAASDVMAWSLLAVVAVGAPGPSLMQRGVALIGLGVWILIIRTTVQQVRRRTSLERLHPVTLIGFTLMAASGSAVASDLAGFHAIIGPLLLGAALPHKAELHQLLEGTLAQTVRAALLPFFYLTVGLALDISAAVSLRATLTLLLAAVAGKVGGVLLGARLTGSGWPEAWRLGVLLNTRGLTELVFLTSGLQLGILPKPLYTSLVVVTLITTLATGPLLDVGRRHLERAETAN
nr:cation:proton antiporter [Deinococcus irradiatisoli]